MRFGGIGTTELIIVLVIVLIIFGVGRLPEIGGAMGKAIREFRRSQSTDTDEEKKEQATQDTEKQEETKAKS